MKMLGIVLLLLVPLMGFSLMMDFLQGFDLNTALQNAISPFRVMEVAELFVLFLFIFMLIAESFRVYRKRKQAKN